MQIPRSTSRPYQAFRTVLGEDAVGWVGRNLKLRDLRDDTLTGSFKVIGGNFTRAQARVIAGATVFAAIVQNPVQRVLAQWNGAVSEENHKHHDAAQTFMLREIFEEDHPFAAELSNAATRYVMPQPGEQPAAQEALKALQKERWIIGEPEHAKQFCNFLARNLGCPIGSFDETAFVPPRVNPVRGELLRLIKTANAQDLALIEGLRALREEGRKVVRTRPHRTAQGKTKKAQTARSSQAKD